ncbi:MAG: ABC transporter ATP-binding protein [Actinomycetia bacterium]|nr:ABC transporter ATP-binding protein [Actinomycetes bacterium]
MSDFSIRAVDLSKRFRQQTERRTSLKELFIRGRGSQPEAFYPLRDVSFTLKPGESMGILGRNGAGKSTALKVIAGLYRPTSGTLEVKGRVSTLLELGAGFHPELTGRENIQLNAVLLGLSRAHMDEGLDRIIDFTGLRDFIDEPIKTYSSGMKVRLAYAIAVEIEPDILIIDEIIAVGDQDFREQCFAHIKKIRQSGATMVIVSHSMATLSELCDTALWLDKGRTHMLGPVDEVTQAYAASAAKPSTAAN